MSRHCSCHLKPSIYYHCHTKAIMIFVTVIQVIKDLFTTAQPMNKESSQYIDQCPNHCQLFHAQTIIFVTKKSSLVLPLFTCLLLLCHCCHQKNRPKKSSLLMPLFTCLLLLCHCSLLLLLKHSCSANFLP